MLHNMKLWREPFESIKSGRKTIELRLCDEKRRKIRVGDFIRFDLVGGEESLTAEVVALYPFASFEELYKVLPLEKCGYEDVSKAKWQDMEEYYSKEEREKYGVLGIEVRVCKI